MLTVILSVLAGISIGFLLGIQYLLHLQKTGAIVPVSPFVAPLKENQTTVNSIPLISLKKKTLNSGQVNLYTEEKKDD